MEFDGVCFIIAILKAAIMIPSLAHKVLDGMILIFIRFRPSSFPPTCPLPPAAFWLSRAFLPVSAPGPRNS